MVKKKSVNDRSWKALQRVSQKGLSVKRFRERWQRFFPPFLRTSRRMFVLTVILFLVIVSGAVYQQRVRVKEGFWRLCEKLGIQQLVQEIKIESDGVLARNPPLLMRFLGLRVGVPMMSVSIDAVQKRLQGLEQVKSVVVERIFPKTVRIRIREYKPAMKIAFRDKDSRLLPRFVSEEGVIFKAFGYKQLPQVPFLAGVVAKKRADGTYAPIPEVTLVDPLLKIARLKYPPLYGEWVKVSLGSFDKRRGAVWSTIAVVGKDGGMIAFGSRDFSEQLYRLNAILDVLEKRKLRASWIDLRLDKPVVRLKK
jgi:hypothetical protein